VTAAMLGQPAEDVDSAGDDDLVLWSVTSILGVLDKPALLYWAAEMTGVAAIAQQSTWRGMLEDCDTGCRHDSAARCPAVKWLRDARFRRPKDRLSSMKLGSAIHSLCEEYALTGVRPDADRIAEEVNRQGDGGARVDLEAPVLTAMLDRFDGWLQRFTPSYQATEVAVYHPEYGYAGQCDGFMTIDGVRLIFDYKSSRTSTDGQGKTKGPQSEVALQLAAYRNAKFAAGWRPRRTERYRRRYYLLSAAERALAVPVPEVDDGIVIWITPDAPCEAFPARCDERIHEQFLFVQEAARWANETARTVLGPPLVPARIESGA
jgi:PD-(D/E)XK nuclease superfamily